MHKILYNSKNLLQLVYSVNKWNGNLAYVVSEVVKDHAEKN